MSAGLGVRLVLIGVLVIGRCLVPRELCRLLLGPTLGLRRSDGRRLGLVPGAVRGRHVLYRLALDRRVVRKLLKGGIHQGDLVGRDGLAEGLHHADDAGKDLLGARGLLALAGARLHAGPDAVGNAQRPHRSRSIAGLKALLGILDATFVVKFLARALDVGVVRVINLLARDRRHDVLAQLTVGGSRDRLGSRLFLLPENHGGRAGNGHGRRRAGLDYSWLRGRRDNPGGRGRALGRRGLDGIGGRRGGGLGRIRGRGRSGVRSGRRGLRHKGRLGSVLHTLGPRRRSRDGLRRHRGNRGGRRYRRGLGNCDLRHGGYGNLGRHGNGGRNVGRHACGRHLNRLGSARYHRSLIGAGSHARGLARNVCHCRLRRSGGDLLRLSSLGGGRLNETLLRLACLSDLRCGLLHGLDNRHHANLGRYIGDLARLGKDAEGAKNALAVSGADDLLNLSANGRFAARLSRTHGRLSHGRGSRHLNGRGGLRGDVILAHLLLLAGTTLLLAVGKGLRSIGDVVKNAQHRRNGGLVVDGPVGVRHELGGDEGDAPEHHGQRSHDADHPKRAAERSGQEHEQLRQRADRHGNRRIRRHPHEGALDGCEARTREEVVTLRVVVGDDDDGPLAGLLVPIRLAQGHHILAVRSRAKLRKDVLAGVAHGKHAYANQHQHDAHKRHHAANARKDDAHKEEYHGNAIGQKPQRRSRELLDLGVQAVRGKLVGKRLCAVKLLLAARRRDAHLVVEVVQVVLRLAHSFTFRIAAGPLPVVVD